jgi:hypothetical protein
MKQTPAAHTASKTSICKRRRFFQPMKQNAAASAESGKNGLRFCSLFAFDVLEIVSAVEVVLPAGVTVAGAKLHAVPAGSPEQLNITVELNPFCGTTETFVVPGVPGETLKDVGEAEIVKSVALGRLILYTALATALFENPLATAIA